MMGGQIRIIVTGGRHRQDCDLIWEQLDQATTGHGQITIVHGACPTGADEWAYQWCHIRAVLHGGLVIAEEQHPAARETHGQAAGPIRDTEMVRLGADLVLAFPDPTSQETWYCAKTARNAGIPVRIIRTPDDPPRRIQRGRDRGWRLPYSAVTIRRPGPFGNPFPAEEPISRYREWARSRGNQYRNLVRQRLAGWDVACFCHSDSPCHGDVLFTVANGGEF